MLRLVARRGLRAGTRDVRTYRGSVWGVLVTGDLITVGLPMLVLGSFGMLGRPELGLVLAAATFATIVATAFRPRVRIGPDGIEVRNRLRTFHAPLGVPLRNRHYLFSTRSDMSYLVVDGRRIPVVAATWLSKGGNALEDDLARSTKWSHLKA